MTKGGEVVLESRIKGKFWSGLTLWPDDSEDPFTGGGVLAALGLLRVIAVQLVKAFNDAK